MLTLEEVAKQSREERFERLERAADTFAAGVNGRSDAELGRRPDAVNWAANEVVCHIRDAEVGTFGGLGQMSVDHLVSVMAWHDQNHVEQLTRALDGRA